jgi:hypothetical protein
LKKNNPMKETPKPPTQKELSTLGKKNQGWRIERTTSPDLPLEREFANEWRKINKPIPNVNHGYGALQDLFIGGGFMFSPFSPRYVVRKITPTDRMIVATIIQWLGSPVGFGFLTTVLDKAGFDIVPRKKINHEKN